MDGFSRELLERLPLAEAAWVLMRHAAGPEMLNELFERHRGSCYEDKISFDLLVELVHAALVVHGGSGRRSFAQARGDERLDASNQAVYGKLRRLPIGVSEALLAQTSLRLHEIQPAQTTRELPACVRDFQVLHVDGKKIKRLAKRLAPLRSVKGSLLGGKILVALEGRSGIALAMAASPNGEANDAPLVPGLVSQIRSLPDASAHRRLWVADRQFSDLTIPAHFAQENDAFLIRHSKKLGFHANPERPAQSTTDARGRRIRDEWGWIGRASDPRRRAVRRITLERPGSESISVLTNLVEVERFSAADLLAVYGERWEIEKVFQQVTEVFALQHLIGSSPEAAVFQAGFCLLLYNLVQTLRSYVAQESRRSPRTISSELLFRDVQGQLVCWRQLGPAQLPSRILEQPDDVAFVCTRLRELLHDSWRETWQKSPPKKSTRPPHQTPVPGGHSSAWKLLQASQQNNR